MDALVLLYCDMKTKTQKETSSEGVNVKSLVILYVSCFFCKMPKICTYMQGIEDERVNVRMKVRERKIKTLKKRVQFKCGT